MFSQLLFIILLLHFYCKALNLNPNSPSNITDIPMDVIENWLTKPLLHIESLHLHLRSTSYQQDADNSYTKWFLRQSLVPITIRMYELTMNVETTDYYNQDNNVIVTNMENLRSTGNHFQRRGGTYFYIVHGDINFAELREFFSLCWKRLHIFQNFILTDNGVLVYDPFELHESGDYGKVIKYGGRETMERILFYNMRGYPMRVQLFKSVFSRPEIDPITKKVKHIVGVDGRVASLLQKKLNFTMDLQDPDPNFFGERSPNGTFNGAIGSIINNELDLCLTGFFIKEYMVPQMEFSVAVYDDKLCIFTPKAKQIPQSILPLFAVSYDLWFSFILMAFVCSFFWAILRRLNLHFNRFQLQRRRLEQKFKWQYAQILNDTWVVWVRVNITRYPPFSSEKLFVASLCLISVIFGSIFESSLSTVFIQPLYYKDIYTLQELDESGLQIIYKYASMRDDLFFSETSTVFANLNKKLLFESNINTNVVVDVATKGGKAGVTRYTNLQMRSSEFILSKRIWIVPECPKYYTISYVWPKNAPWNKTINQLLLRILNAGLINKYITEVQSQVDAKIMRDHVFEANQKFKILTIEDLQLAFYVVLIGSLLASLSLLVEKKLFSKKHSIPK